MDERGKERRSRFRYNISQYAAAARGWFQPPVLCFGPLKDLAPTRRARDMRAITRHVSSICIQEDLAMAAMAQRWRGTNNGGGWMHDTDSSIRPSASVASEERHKMTATSLTERSANEPFLHIFAIHKSACTSFCAGNDDHSTWARH